MEVVCIVCPNGCEITVAPGEPAVVTGHKCDRGKAYALEEYTAPKRVLTTTVRLLKGKRPRLPVRTRSPIPKELMRRAAEELKGVTVEAPVVKGQIIVADILGTGVDVVASRSERQKT